MGARRTFFWETLPPEKLWYLVGLITTDGCLSPDGRHIDITAKDKNFLKEICKQFGLNVSVGKKQSGYTDQWSHRIQFSAKSFYDFLLGVQLTPKKSKTLGVLKVPDDHFSHFLRGVIDGDGCIRSWIHPQNGVEQWIVKITSASERFLKWIASKIKEIYQVSGALHPKYTGGAYDLKFGKLAAQELLKICYTKNVFALPRKLQKARQCITTKRGWNKSKTVKNVACPGGEIGKLTGLQ